MILSLRGLKIDCVSPADLPRFQALPALYTTMASALPTAGTLGSPRVEMSTVGRACRHVHEFCVVLQCGAAFLLVMAIKPTLSR